MCGTLRLADGEVPSAVVDFLPAHGPHVAGPLGGQQQQLQQAQGGAVGRVTVHAGPEVLHAVDSRYGGPVLHRRAVAKGSGQPVGRIVFRPAHDNGVAHDGADHVDDAFGGVQCSAPLYPVHGQNHVAGIDLVDGRPAQFGENIVCSYGFQTLRGNLGTSRCAWPCTCWAASSKVGVLTGTRRALPNTGSIPSRLWARAASAAARASSRLMSGHWPSVAAVSLPLSRL